MLKALANSASATFAGADVRGANFSRSDPYSSDAITPAQLYSTASYQAHDLTGIILDNTRHWGDLSGQNLTNSSFQGADLNGANLSGANLSNANFTNAYMPLVNLSNANVSNANLRNADLYVTVLTGANFTGAEVRGANLSYFSQSGSTPITLAQLTSTASYQAHDLSGINLGNVDLTGANFTSQNLTGARFDGGGYPAILDNADFNQANLTGANVSALMTGANFNQANLTNATVGGTMTGANFSGAVIRGATISGGMSLVQLYSTASYQAHDLVGIQIQDGDLTHGNFANQDLTNAQFGSFYGFVLLNGANFTQANLSGVRFWTASGQVQTADANFTQANLSDAIFAHLQPLTNANFSQANLIGAQMWANDFSGANFTDADVRWATMYGDGDVTHDLTLAQLYSTASYKAHDLTGLRTAGYYFNGGNFVGQNLSYASVGGMLSNADFSHASLTHASLGYGDMTNANFSHANLSYASVGGTLTNANFSQTNLTGALVRGTLTGANFTGAEVRGADFGGTNLSAAQLYATASYQAHDLTGIALVSNNLTGWNFAGQHLTNANFDSAMLSGADFSGADVRGAIFSYNNNNLTDANTTNLIQSNGHIAGLDLTAGATLVVRDYDGGVPIVVEQHLAMDAASALRMVFEADAWNSTVSFAAGIPVTLGGTLELTFAPNVHLASQLGRTIDLFHWTGVSSTGTFAVSSPYTWNLANLYTTGEVTLTAIPGMPGDFNQDGSVDAADYVLLRKTNGSAAQYTEWRTHFGTQAAPKELYARGTWNGFDQSNPLVHQGDGHYEVTVTGLAPGALHNFKVADADYSLIVPAGTSNDVRLAADANGEINLHFWDPTTAWTDGWFPVYEPRVGYDDPNQFDWELMGSFNAWTGGAAWFMTDEGSGLHRIEVALAAGSYEFKFRKQGDWGISIGDNFGNSAANATTGALAAGNYAFELDLPNGRWRVSPVGGGSSAAIPEPAAIALMMIAAVMVMGLERRRCCCHG
jgi:uncharacterized protein YjbI with pentapeptide repeats